MTKEVRVLFLTALTLSAYAISIYVNQGALIFPFPLNELILLIVSIQFSIWNYKKRTPTLFILGVAFFAFLGNEIYWSFILEDKAMYSFSSLPLTDIFKLLSAICLLGFSIHTMLAQKKILYQIFSVLFIVLYLGSLTYFPSYYFFFALIFMSCGLLFQPVNKPFHLFWILLLLLESTKYLTLIINN